MSVIQSCYRTNANSLINTNGDQYITSQVPSLFLVPLVCLVFLLGGLSTLISLKIVRGMTSRQEEG